MRTIAMAALLVTTFAAGCETEGRGGPCSQRAGTYRFTFTERTGTCGPLAEQIGTITEEPVNASPCSGQIVYSADNCETTSVAIVCPENSVGPGATSTTNGKTDWSEDGSRGNGTEAVVVKDSTQAVVCQSSYDVAATKL